jgi:hypothetical protein
MRQRLLAIDVLPHPHSRHGDHSVQVIRCGDDDRIDVFLSFEHLAKIGVHGGLRESFEYPRGVSDIHVTERDDVFGLADVGDVRPAHASDADRGYVQLVAGRGHAAPQHVAWHDGECRGSCRGPHDVTA